MLYSDDDEVRVQAPQFRRRELSVEMDEDALRDRIAHLEADIAESSSRLRRSLHVVSPNESEDDGRFRRRSP